MPGFSRLSSTDLPFGKKTTWFVTFVDPSTGHIFCNLAEPSVAVKYERLEHGIKNLVSSEQLQKKFFEPIIGEFCLAKSSEDNLWYRSQITHVDREHKHVEVNFIDFGNSDFVPFDSVREIPNQFNELEPRAYECVLANVEPVLNSEKWSDRAIELIKELVLDQELVGISVRLKRNVLVLQLYADKEATVTVAEQLISAGFAQPKKLTSSIASTSVVGRKRTSAAPTKKAISISSSTSSSGSKKQESQTKTQNLKEKQTGFKSVTEFSVDNYVDLCVVYVNSINDFYCQLTLSKNDLILLQENLQKAYSVPTPNAICKVKQPCCAKFSDDDNWYRGIIKTVNGNSSCEVFFIDYGNTDNVIPYNIKELRKDLYALPAQAIHCSLSGVQPLNSEDEFSARAIEMFEEQSLIDTSLVGLIVKVTNSGIEVILHDAQDKPINQILVNKNVVAALGEQLEENNQGNNQSVSSQSAVIENCSNTNNVISYVPLNLTPGSIENVFVTFCYSPHLFFINLSRTYENLEKLMTEIKAVYKGADTIETVKSPSIGLQCATTFSEDGEYYRAIIKGINKNQAEVFFVDYGNSEEKPMEELKCLRKEFIKLPKQAIQCSLADIQPVNDGAFSTAALEKFESLTVNKDLQIKVIKVVNNACIVNLKEVDENKQIKRINISNELVLAGCAALLAQTTQNDIGNKILTQTARYKELKIEVNSYLEVAPVDVVSPAQFCCHVVRNAVEFKLLTEELNSFYKTSKPDSTVSWKKLMPCVALYQEDKSWYRAIVTKVESRSAEVTFVDFGNAAKMSVDNLRPIYEKFLKLPTQVFVCSLADVVCKGTSSWDEKSCTEFTDLVLDKHLAGFVKEKFDDNSFSMMLYDTKSSPEVNIGQWLIQKNYAVPKADAQVLGCSQYANPNSIEEIYVSIAAASNNYFVQLQRHSEDLDKLMLNIEAYYTKLKSSDLWIFTPIIGQFCCAKFTEDDGWYRACIDEVQGNNISVTYIDYGNKEAINIERIKVLQADFSTDPKYALPCICESRLVPEKELSVKFLSKTHPYKISITDGSTVINKESQQETPTAEVKEVTLPSTDLKAATQHNGTCYVVESATVIKGQLESFQEQLDVLMGEIAAVAESAPVLSNPTPGQLCLAKYSLDEVWYRGKVISVEGAAQVEFIDYGNCDAVESSNIRVLSADFAKLPQTCVSVSLFDVHANDIDIAATKTWLNNIVIEALLKLDIQEVTDPTNISAYVYTEGSEVHLNDQIYEQFAHEEEPSPEVGEPASTPVVTQQETPTEVEEIKTEVKAVETPAEVKEVTLPSTDLKAATQYNSTCFVVESATVIKCQLESFQEQLDVLMGEITAVAESAPVLSNPGPGQLCLAKYSLDEVWYRGKVISVEGATQVEFIDYGNCDAVESSNIRVLSANFAKLPQTCVSVTLFDVHADEIDIAATKAWLDNTVIVAPLNLDIQEVTDPTNISAYVYTEGSVVHLNDQIYEQFALGEEASSEVVEPASTPVVTQQEKPTEVEEIKTEVKTVETPAEVKEVTLPSTDLKAATQHNSTCFMVESATIIKCQLESFQERLDVLMGEIAAVAESAPVLSNPTPGQLCLAKYSLDEVWYRGKVISVEGATQVEFIDYGNCDAVESSNIRVLSADFAKLPQTCVSVTLFDVHADDIDIAATKAWLDNTVIVAPLNLDIQEVTDPTNISAYVYTEGSVVHLNDQIYEQFALGEEASSEVVEPASTPVVTQQEKPTEVEEIKTEVKTVETPAEVKEVTLPSTDLKAATQHNSTCFVVESATIIKCQLESFQERLDVLMGEIAAVAESAAVLSNPTPGQLCLAKYSLDEVWYRGKVISVEGATQVEFIDYGNCDAVESSNIRVLSADFAKLPQTCVSVTLFDVHADDIDIAATKAWLDNTVIVAPLNLDIQEVTDPTNISAYVYTEGSEVHLNDQIYEQFALGEEASSEVVEPASTPVVTQQEKPTEVEEIKTEVKTVETQAEVNEVTLPSTDLKAATQHNSTCFVVESATVIKCQLESFQEQLDVLMGEIAAVAELAPVLSNPGPGQLCLAKYSLDEVWYRGKVISVEGATQVEFIDYGNCDTVESSNIRVLSADFAKLPQTCVSVTLFDVHADDIDIAATKAWLDNTVIEALLNLDIQEVTDPTNISAYVYTEGSEVHLNDQIYEQFALGEEASSEVVEPASTPVVTQQEKPTEVEEIKTEVKTVETPAEVKEVTLPSTDLKAATQHNSTCFVVESATVIKCQLESFQEQLDVLMGEIAAVAESAPVLSNPAPGQLCLAKYSFDEVWYRGKVISVEGATQVEFIDYGNCDAVQFSNIRVLSANFAKLPQTCVSVTLFDVHAYDIDITATKAWLDNTVIVAPLNLDIQEVTDPTNISAYVYTEGSEVHLNDQIYEQFALGEEASSEVVEPASTPVVTQQEKPTEVEEIKTEVKTVETPAEVKEVTLPSTNLKAATQHNSTCFVVESATIIKCQLESFQEQLDVLMGEIAAVAELAPVLSNPGPGQLCLAKYSLDEVWYRGKVISVEGATQVEFIDYGNCDTVESSNIRVLSVDFAKLPQTCVSVTLFDVHADDIDIATTKAWLDNTVIEALLNLDIQEVTDPTNISAYVYTEGSEVHLNDQIYEQFALGEEASSEVVEPASTPVVTQQEKPTEVEEIKTEVKTVETPAEVKEVTLPSTDLKAATQHNSTCFVVESATVIKCQLESFQEQLDVLMSEIAAVAESAPVLSNPAPGQLCLAKYSLDEVWYRGKVISVEGATQVEFIDYGNCDAVQFSNIRVLSANFAKLPQTCVSVTLFDVHAYDIDITATKAWLDNTVIVAPLSLDIQEVTDPTNISAYVYTEGSEVHLNDQIYEQFALGEEASSEVVEPASTPVVTQQEKPTEVEEIKTEVKTVETPAEVKEVTLPSTNLKAATQHNSTCFVVESATIIKCQLESFQERLDVLMGEIAAVAESAPVLSNPAPGQLCLAKYSLDEVWYRGKVISVEGATQVEFIDYGNCDTVESSNIRVLSANFAKLPQTCVSVTLFDVHADDIDIAATKAWLDNTVIVAPLNLDIQEVTDPTNISAYAYTEGSEVHLNDQIYEQFALGEEASSEVVEPASTPVVTQQEKPTEVEEIKTEVKTVETPAEVKEVTLPSTDLKAATQHNSTCFVVESATVIKCQLESFQEQLDVLMGEIAAVAESAPVLSNPAPGQLCLAKYLLDEVWYRGKVISVEGATQVEFIDYGNCDAVESSNIRVLSADFAKLPQTCVSVTLFDVHADDIDIAATKAWLDNTVIVAPLNLDIQEVTDPTNISAYVYTEESEVHLNDQIYEQFALGEEAPPLLNGHAPSEKNTHSECNGHISPSDLKIGLTEKMVKPMVNGIVSTYAWSSKTKSQ